VSLVREHAEIIRPPRTLWVPFPLGRPLGSVNDPAFQTRVLRAALDLFHRPHGPVLEDFPEDAPIESVDELECAVCPVILPKPPPPEDRTGLREAVLSEIDQLAPWYDLGRQRRGRSQVGLSGLTIADAARFLDAWLAGETRKSPLAGTSTFDALRWCGEDLKAFYLEAATARPGQMDSKQLSDWFWLGTSAGAMLKALRKVLIADEAADIRDVGHFMLMPEAYFDDD
jgi:hypothetical protein